MTLLDFQSKFRTDDDCRNHLFRLRWPDGFRCPQCGHDRFYVIRERHLLQCQSAQAPPQSTLPVSKYRSPATCLWHRNCCCKS
ncbi:MAG: transposase [Bacilli bacterium]